MSCTPYFLLLQEALMALAANIVTNKQRANVYTYGRVREAPDKPWRPMAAPRMKRQSPTVSGRLPKQSSDS